MADITMCAKKECALRGRCYRAQAKASEYQSYAVFEPECLDDGVYCKDFWSMEDKRI